MNQQTNKSMMLFTTFWNEDVTFKLMPLSSECPFIEVIYEPNTEMLIVINKHFKQTFHNVPKLDDNGDLMMMKTAPRKNGKPFKEERRTLESYQEYYLIDRQEQIEFIQAVTVNADDFDYEKFMVKKSEEPAIYQPEKSPILDKNGIPVAPSAPKAKAKKLIKT